MRTLNGALAISLVVFIATFVAHVVVSRLLNRRKVFAPPADAGWIPASVRVQAALWAMGFSALVFASLCFGSLFAWR